MEIFNKLIQVGFISKQLKRIMDSYINIYNIGPWYLLKFCPQNVHKMEVYGKKQNYEMNVAVCPIGDVRFEYIEPLTESIFSDFYKLDGEDVVHHLKFAVGDYKEAIDFLKSKDIDLIQKGQQQGDRGENIFNFFETTEKLGFVTEIVMVTKDFIKPQPEKWVGADHGDFEPIFIRPSVIGIAVEDIEEKVRKYKILNIGPWKIHEFKDESSLGFTAKMAFCKFGNVTIKLIEPKSNSIFSETLSQYGEGVHHIKMEVDNYLDKLNYLRSKGLKVISSGNYKDKINYSFLDTKKHLNFIVQLSDKNIQGESEQKVVIHP